MNNMKSIFQNRFTNLGGKLRFDRNSDSDSLALPPYVESLYTSFKNDKEIYNELYKKMSTISVQNYIVSDDKKMKKNSWETLSNLLSESEKKISGETVTKEVLENSIKIFDEMAHCTKDFEKTISLNVIKKFQELSEDNTIPMTKKALTSLSKEMKANSERVQSLQEQLNSQPSDTASYRKSVDVGAIASTENKLISAQIIEENNEKEWDNKKDLYLTKLFAAEAEKVAIAEKIVEFFQCYYDYYVECENILSKCIPELKICLERHKQSYAFNVPLEEHLSATNRKLSYVLETCIQELDNEDTLQHEGLFRISGGKAKMELLKNALNVMRVDDFITKGCNSAVYAGVLKQYLRELPIPLMTYELYDRWCEVGTKIRQNDTNGIMTLVKECLASMPTCYYDNLAYLMQFLNKISAYESVNKMSASNLGLMLGPNLIRNNFNSNGEEEVSAVMILGSPGGSVLEFMIIHFIELFPNAPVYPTTVSIKTSDMSLYERESDKNARKITQSNDDDSVSSNDLKLDDNISTSGTELNDSLKNDQMLKSSREPPNNKVQSFRKAPAPPPPPQSKPYIIDSENDVVKETLTMRTESRPTVKKRMSKLNKPISEQSNELEELKQNEARVISLRPNYVPSLPNKKPNIPLASSDCFDKPTRPENPPPKRPNNPPPPILPFEKFKENLDLKQQTPELKLSYHEESSSISPNPETMSSGTAAMSKKPSGEGATTSF